DSHRRPVCAVGQPRTSTDVLCVLADTHGRPVTNVLICVLIDSHGRPVCADGHTQTHMDSHGYTHGRPPQTSCVCWQTPVDVLCVLKRQPTWAKITQTVHGKGQRAESRDQLHEKGQRAKSKDQRADMYTDGQPRTATDVLCVLADTHGHSPQGPKSPELSTGRVNVLSPRTNVLICVLMDSNGRYVCADGQTRTHTDNTHGRPVCTEQTAHEGQNHPNSPREGSACCQRTNVLICVLMDSHGRHVCADGHTRTAPDVLCVLTNTHGRPVCADGHPQTSCVRTHTDTHRQPQMSCVCWRTPTDVLCVLTRQPTWAKITRTVHGMGQRAESKDQRADMCTDGQPQTSCTNTHRHTQTATDVLCVLADTHGRPVSTDVLCVLTNTHGRPVCADGHTHGRPVCADGHPRTSYSPRGPKSPEQSTGRVSVLSPRTNVLICVLTDTHGRPPRTYCVCWLMDSHGRPVCADGHTRTHMDSHRRPVCADGHPRTQPTWAKITQTVHRKGQRAESKDQRADMSTNVLCVLADTHRHTRTATDVLCVLTDSHGQAQTCCVCWRTPTDVLSTDVLCVLADTHGCPVCTEQTAHVGQNHPNSPREGPAC
ncbi:unnamed protein product, partial [Brassica rapa]